MSDVSTRMRASVLHGVGDLRLEERAVPVPGPSQVLVRIAAVGICGSDVHYYREGRIGDFVVDAPLVLGHEASGTIVAVGAGVPDSRRGERVSIEPQHVCRRCDQCRAGRYNLCERIEFYATPPVDGAFAEFAVIDEDFAHPLPDSVSDEAGALLEPLSVAIWAAGKAGISAGSRVLIAGAGPIGIVTAQVARALGATDVVVSDTAAVRREAVARYGATRVIDPASDDAGGGFDAFVDASGAPAAIRSGIAQLRPAGIAVLVGMGADELSLPVALIQNRELVVTGVFRYAGTWPAAIGLAATGAVDLDSLVTGRFGLQDVAAALDSTGDPHTLKSLVVPGELS